MGRAASIVGAAVAALVGCGQATAATATTTARVIIIEGTVVRMNWTLAMPSVRAGGEGAAFVGNTPSMVLGAMLTPGGGRLSVRREDATGAPITAPASFEVVNAGGVDAVVVRTNADEEVSISRDRAIVGGTLQGRSAASIEVARGLLPVSASGQTLVVVVQYN